MILYISSKVWLNKTVRVYGVTLAEIASDADADVETGLIFTVHEIRSYEKS